MDPGDLPAHRRTQQVALLENPVCRPSTKPPPPSTHPPHLHPPPLLSAIFPPPLQCETTQDGHQEILIHIIGVRHWDDNLFSLCCWRPKVEYSTFFSHVHPLTGNVRNTNVSIKIFIVWFSMFVPQKVLGKEKRKMWEKDDRLLLLDALWRGRECW